MDASVSRLRSGTAISMAAALLCLLTAAPAAAVPSICDGSTALTLVGMDTATGRTLFSVTANDGKASWLVELDGDGG